MEEIINLHRIQIDMNILKLMPREVMLKYTAVPFNMESNLIHVAMSNPENEKALEHIKFYVKREVRAYIADASEISAAIKELSERQLTDFALNQLKRQFNEDITKSSNNEYNTSFESSPIVKLTEFIINQAIRRKVSDIHLEPFENEVNIRFRVDGILQEFMNIPRNVYSLLSSRIKIESSMNIAEKRLPQDGKLEFKTEDLVLDLRVSSLPTIYGEKLVIRILYKKEKLFTLSALGFDSDACNKLVNAVKGSHGIILVTGPTGSGKTTTLYAMLNELDKKRNNIVTIEDPVEFTIHGINQVNINAKAGLSFANGLRSILRQDPNFIMLGEIRDEETAQIAIRAAITGHLVISTLHTNDAVTSVLRLIDMGVPNYLVADALSVCTAQRLVRKVCTYCKSEYKPTSKEVFDLDLKGQEVLYKGQGCIFCNYSGYGGRSVVYEIITFDDNSRRMIIDKNIEELKRYNESKGSISLKNCCKSLVLEGITTYEEYLKVTSNF
jgi:type IV pilus assembly protein PilB